MHIGIRRLDCTAFSSNFKEDCDSKQEDHHMDLEPVWYIDVADFNKPGISRCAESYNVLK